MGRVFRWPGYNHSWSLDPTCTEMGMDGGRTCYFVTEVPPPFVPWSNEWTMPT